MGLFIIIISKYLNNICLISERLYYINVMQRKSRAPLVGIIAGIVLITFALILVFCELFWDHIAAAYNLPMWHVHNEGAFALNPSPYLTYIFAGMLFIPGLIILVVSIVRRQRRI